ncbi:MAG: molybdopterin-dependent oxidoreductase, partial [Actinomycetota bacterium]|nr:molybdopterin-dependent oxidoreductase [Actinomycetota bacterium]
LGLMAAGQSIGGPLRPLGLLAPRGRHYGTGRNDFQVNKTATAAGITPAQTGSRWRLELEGARTLELSRDELTVLPLSTQKLPIACVEGWSTTQTWTGVPLRDLARLAGVDDPEELFVQSIQKALLGQTTLNRAQASDPRSLLALRVNGADLSLDHGFPARIIVPALPGVHNTKWVRRLAFRGA